MISDHINLKVHQEGLKNFLYLYFKILRTLSLIKILPVLLIKIVSDVEMWVEISKGGCQVRHNTINLVKLQYISANKPKQAE